MSTCLDDKSVLRAHLSSRGLLQAHITQPEAPLQLVSTACKAAGARPKAEHGVCFIGKGRIELGAL